jgi:hypothetical protein
LWLVGDHGVFAGDELLGRDQGLADFLEDERVKLIGADVALRAAILFAAGSEEVVVGAVVVVEEVAWTSAHLLAAAADVTVAAGDQSA